MKTKTLTAFIKTVMSKMEAHAPEIATGIGVAGMITSTVLAIKVTPKAVRLLDDRKEELDSNKLSVGETIKITWKCYIPVFVPMVLSAGCIIGASAVNLRRNAALAAAYDLSRAALTEYKDAVVETIGEKKELAVREKQAEKAIAAAPVENSPVIITGSGTTLCYDSLSGRYFQSNRQTIESARNVINERMLNEDYISLNDFYEELGLDPTDMGDDIGWNLQNDGLLGIVFASKLATDGTPCLVVQYSMIPSAKYYRCT